MSLRIITFPHRSSLTREMPFGWELATLLAALRHKGRQRLSLAADGGDFPDIIELAQRHDLSLGRATERLSIVRATSSPGNTTSLKDRNIKTAHL